MLPSDLLRPEAWPFDVDHVELHETHISWVFVAGDRAFKVKKPVDLGFVDFTGLEARKRFCEAEVRLNRRLAPDVYLGVVPVTPRGDGLAIGGPGEPVDWAVERVRLSEGARLLGHLDDLDAGDLRDLAQHVARFHATARTGPDLWAQATFERVASNMRENFEQTADHPGRVVDAAVWERARRATEAALARHRDRIEARAERAVDGHGDLRLDHVYRLQDRWVIVDCLEFADRYRFADPVCDVAFLVMELRFAGRPDLADAFANGWFTDPDGRPLLEPYVAYRAAVRAKVRALSGEDERARAHWLQVLATLEPPGVRPCLVLVGGLPGCGKSTLSHRLARDAGFEVIRSDVVRKELAGLPPTTRCPSLYTPEHTERTYAECRARAAAVLQRGGRALIDASFSADADRVAAIEVGRRHGVGVAWLHLALDPEASRERLVARRDDASDADPAVHALLSDRWEPSSRAVARVEHHVDGSGPRGAVLCRALAALAGPGLAGQGQQA